jgi:type I restriction enzyme S subunit
MRASYPTYKSTSIPWMPEMPEHWEQRKNKYLFRRSKSLVGKDFEKYPVLSLTMNGVIRRDLDNPMGKMPATFADYQLIQDNTLLFCLFDYDVTPRTVGMVNEKGIVSPAYTSMYPVEKINLRYYYYWFLMLDERKMLLTHVTNLRNSVSYETFAGLFSPFPPLTEQTAIANYLDAKSEQINRFIAKKEKLIALLKEQKRSLTTEIIQEEAKNVEKIKLKYCVRNVSVQTSQMAKDDIYLGMENVESWTGLYVESEQKDFESQAKMFQFNDVLFGKLRPYLAKVFLANIKGVCSGEFLVLRPSKRIAPEYLQLVLLDPEFISLVNSSTFGAKMPRADWGFIGNQLISLPSIAQQKQIVAMIKSEGETIDKVIGRIEKEIEKVKELKQSLIAEAVTGKIKVA